MQKLNVKDIQKMYEKAFHKKLILFDIKKLDGGFTNEVYLINNGNHKVVLKADTQDLSKLTTVDRNLMWWEAKMLEFLNSQNIPSPEFLYFDDSCEVVSFPYIFMDYVPGVNYFSFKKQMSKRDVESIDYQLGELAYQISSFKPNYYFLPSAPDLKFSNNYDFVSHLFESILNDASKFNCFDSKIYSDVRAILERYKKSLINVSAPRLSHTDMWDGNILVSGNEVASLIDLSDMYICDEIMTFCFHPIKGDPSASFLKGYNHKELNTYEQNRIDIYRMYVIIKMIVKGVLMDLGDLEWKYDSLNSQISRLSRKKED
ncbi:MAG: aminoglycoside phosphotransferase family protein [Bacilli bacterium]|nr:aminoglycoside phosphotransferase family protein [Bacilli bacterium]